MKHLDVPETEQYEYIYKYKNKRYRYKVYYIPKVYPDSITYWFGNIPNNLRRKWTLKHERKKKEAKIRNNVNYPGMSEYEIDCARWSRQYDIQQFIYIITTLLIISGFVLFVLLKHELIFEWLLDTVLNVLDKIIT